MGKSLLLVVLCAACANNVPADRSTGVDGKPKGAKEVVLEDGVGKQRDIVTYPGGDRVDWKVVELPADARGDLALDLSWKGPRPGLDLAFEVWSEWGDFLGKVEPRKWNAKKKSARNASGHKQLELAGVKGKVFVSVFASNRGDAGRYRLSATFKPEVVKVDPKFDETLQKMLATGTVIPEPPKLAVVYAPCGDEYDKSNPDCVASPPPCDRAKKDKNNPSCKNLCDEDKLDPKNPDCKQFYVCTPETWVDPKVNPACGDVEPPPPPTIDPLYKRADSAEVQDGKTIVTIAVGKDSPVAVGWKGSLLDSKSRTKAVLKNGGFTIFKVKNGRAYGKVDLSVDDANRNLEVVIYPPGAEPTK